MSDQLHKILLIEGRILSLLLRVSCFLPHLDSASSDNFGATGKLLILTISVDSVAVGLSWCCRKVIFLRFFFWFH